MSIDVNGALHDDTGRYATNPHAAPGYDLTLSDDEYNARGTAAFPPTPRSAEQHIAFWNTVEIPDRICAKARDTYVPWQVEQCRLRADAAAIKVARKYFDKRYVDGKSVDSIIREEVERVYDQAERDEFPSMERALTRDVVRGCLMHYYSSTLPPAEQEIVKNYQMVVGPWQLTTEHLTRWFAFHAWCDEVIG